MGQPGPYGHKRSVPMQMQTGKRSREPRVAIPISNFKMHIITFDSEGSPPGINITDTWTLYQLVHL